jgi:hypothetical protein
MEFSSFADGFAMEIREVRTLANVHEPILPVKSGGGPTSRTISEHPAVSEILTKYLNYLLCKKSLKPATIKRKVKTIKSLLKHGVELPDPDNVIAFLNTCGWAGGTVLKITWVKNRVCTNFVLLCKEKLHSRTVSTIDGFERRPSPHKRS